MLRQRRNLDWVIELFSTYKVEELTPWVRNILRLGVYQIVFLEKIPTSAATYEAVNLAKRYGHAGTVKLVNALLRKIASNSQKITYPDLYQDPILHISVKYSHPDWLVKRWLNRYGIEETIELCKANNSLPPLAIRVNTLKTTCDELVKVLAKEGVRAEPSQAVPEGLRLKESPPLSELDSFQQGYFQVQDEAAMLISHLVNPQPGEMVIDLCIGAGGKATHLAQLMNNQGQILGLDIYPHKLEMLKETCKRLGVKIVKAHCYDGLKIKEIFLGKADRVLVDAPCSGLGVLRRRPDARWHKKEKKIGELSSLQLALLESGAGCLKEGGSLVYCTCTLEPEENEEVVGKFLERHPEFFLDSIELYLPFKIEGLVNGKGMFHSYPHRHNLDGFFAARMVKTKEGKGLKRD